MCIGFSHHFILISDLYKTSVTSYHTRRPFSHLIQIFTNQMSPQTATAVNTNLQQHLTSFCQTILVFNKMRKKIFCLHFILSHAHLFCTRSWPLKLLDILRHYPHCFHISLFFINHFHNNLQLGRRGTYNLKFI